MHKKKVLVFIDWYLPGYRAGGPIRSCANLIAHLSNEFEFFLVTRDADYMDAVPYSSVNKNTWNKMPDGSSVFYISKDNLQLSVIKKIIKEVNADSIYLNSVYSFYFTIIPLWLINRRESKVIVSVRGMLAPSALAIKSFKKKLFLFVSKTVGLFDNVIFQATSEDEKKQISSIFPKSKIEVALNFSRKISRQNINKIIKSLGEVRLLNVARIAPEKNLLFALEMLKCVKCRAVFDFFGPMYDNSYWEKCKNAIANLPSNIIASYKGVADGEQILKLMENYHFLFLPSRGENFGHVILEAMSAGLPVIISDKTPWKNLEEKMVGWDISLNDFAKFSEIIEKCAAMTNDEYETYSKCAIDFASAYMNNEGNVKSNRQLFS